MTPEHPFPAAVDDALAATRWALTHAGELGADERRVAVAGDSAVTRAGASPWLRHRPAVPPYGRRR